MTTACQAKGPLTVAALSNRLLRLRPASSPFIIGITGSVAVGKSTFARALASSFTGGRSVELVGTDGFLLPNALLDARGLTLRKGFPESFDAEALANALSGARNGPVKFPGYSHVSYDVDPGLSRSVDRPDVLIVEGLGLGPHRALIDALIFVEACEDDLESWFVARFLGLWEAAATDGASFYVRFRTLDRPAATAFARSVWTSINLPNLREFIAPQRQLADLIVHKGPDHQIVAVGPD